MISYISFRRIECIKTINLITKLDSNRCLIESKNRWNAKDLDRHARLTTESLHLSKGNEKLKCLGNRVDCFLVQNESMNGYTEMP